MGRAGRPPERPLSMPYRVTFHAAASASIPGLPAEAFEALVEVLVMAGRDPYKTGSPDPDDPAHRHATFGGLGLVAYRIDEAAEVVHVYHVMWAG